MIFYSLNFFFQILRIETLLLNATFKEHKVHILLFKKLSKRQVDGTNDQRPGAYLGQRISIAVRWLG